MRRAAWIIGFIAVQAACIWVVQPDLGRLWAGLPRLAGWIAGGFPPDFSGFGDLAARAAETLALEPWAPLWRGFWRCPWR
ncbi:MAG: hypothetical protein ACKO9A_14910 [Alphaproteobacteria bacterium]